MNWKKLVEKKNANTFVLPSGWDSKDSVAEQLDCSPEKVREHLRPALKSGEVLEQQFKVWQPELKRCVMVTAYRESDGVTSQGSTKVKLDVAVLRKLKASGKSYAEIGVIVGRNKDVVRNTLRRAKD